MKRENVICVPLEALNSFFDLSKQFWRVEKETLNSLPYMFEGRQQAEKDFNRKQLIPYALLHNKRGEVLCYQRHGSEKRLSDIYSVGIGGHVNDGDVGDSLFQRLVSGLKREFSEEIGLTVPEERFELVGMINEDYSEVGHCHIGVVFSVVVGEEKMLFNEEIGNPRWSGIEELDLSKFELWSSLALRLWKSVR